MEDSFFAARRGANVNVASDRALMGARGNSGVILSQMLRAYVRHLAGAAIESRPAETIAAIQFPTQEQVDKAKALITEQWGPMVADQ